MEFFRAPGPGSASADMGTSTYSRLYKQDGMIPKYTGYIPRKYYTTLLPQNTSSHYTCIHGWFMVFNTTFNNISVILWWSVLLVDEIGVPGENH